MSRGFSRFPLIRVFPPPDLQTCHALCALFVHLEPDVAFSNGDVSDRRANVRFINEFMRQDGRSKSAAIYASNTHVEVTLRVLGYPLGKIAISSRPFKK
jgi:hypothetical protein